MFKWWKEWREKRKKKEQAKPNYEKVRAYSSQVNSNLYNMEPSDQVPQDLLHAAMFGTLRDGTPVNLGDTIIVPEGRFHVRSVDNNVGTMLFDRLDEPTQSVHSHTSSTETPHDSSQSSGHSSSWGDDSSSSYSSHDTSSDCHHSTHDSCHSMSDYSSSYDSGSYDSASSCDSGASSGGWD